MIPAITQSMINGVPDELEKLEVYPDPVIIDGATSGPMVCVGRKSKITFSNGNYLGLAKDPRAVKAAALGLREYGLTASGSRLVCGTLKPHVALESTIAKFQGTQKAIVYFLTSATSMSVIRGILDSVWRGYLKEFGLPEQNVKVEIFRDWHSHPTLDDACCACRYQKDEFGREVRLSPYKHGCMNHLERLLKESNAEIKMIVTDGIFSADGDLAPLPDIVELSRRHNAMVLVDDAHGVGILGKHGRGIWEHFGLEDGVDFPIGSCAKAFAGGLGGFLACSEKLDKFLRDDGGHYMFGGSIPPAYAIAIRRNIITAMVQPERRIRVLENAYYMRTALRNLGYKVLGDGTPILPILIGGSDESSAHIEYSLREAGYIAPSFRFPAAPKRLARIRVTMTACHSHEQIQGFVGAFHRIADGRVKIRAK